MLDRLLNAIAVVEKAASSVAAAFMFAIMIIVFSDVIMRYAFNKPFSWAYDLISLYLMAGIFFLVLSEAYASNAHVSVDILQQKFPPAAGVTHRHGTASAPAASIREARSTAE